MKGNNACQKEQHSEWEIAVFCIVALGVLLTFNILIFRNSRDSLLKLQEDNMLATAKTVANSLHNFYDRENWKTRRSEAIVRGRIRFLMWHFWMRAGS